MASAEAVLKYRTEGYAETLRGAQAVAQASAQLAERTQRAAQVQAALEGAQRRLAMAYKQAEAELSAYNQAGVQAANTNEAMAASLDRVAQAEAGAAKAATQASQQTVKAANDNASSYASLAEAITSATELAVKHPLATAAAVAASAQGLSTLSRVASSSLSTASDAMRGYSERTQAANENVSALASVTADGLGVAANYATLASDKFATLATRFAPGAAGATMLARALGQIGPLLGPIGLGISAVAVGSAAIERAYQDLEKLIAVGERAEKLDFGATLVAGFDKLGEKLGLATDQAQAALDRVSGLLREKYGQGNPLTKVFADLDAAGDSNLSAQVKQQAELAQTTAQRFRVALDAMRELEGAGKRLALLDLADKMLGPSFAEQLRTGQTSVAEIAADLDKFQGKQLFSDADAKRAVALSREIEDTKFAIGETMASAFNFAKLAMSIDGIWLGILKTVQAAADGSNKVIENAGKAINDRIVAQVRQAEETARYMESVTLKQARESGDDFAVETILRDIAVARAAAAQLQQTIAEIADTKIDRMIGDVGPPLRFASEAMQELDRQAAAAAGTIPGLDGALGNLAGSAANAAVKIGSVADGIRALQGLNPNLSGALGYLDKVKQTQATYAETIAKATADFDRTGDETAKTKAVTAAIDEQQRTLRALAAERDKPLTSLVQEGERTKLDDLGRSIAQIGDRVSETRQKISEGFRVSIANAASPDDAQRLQKQLDGQLQQLDASQKLLEAKARTDAASKAASGAKSGGGADALDNALQRTRDETEELEIQAGALTRVSEEAIRFAKTRELMRAAAKAGRADEAGLAETIDAVADAYARQSVATDRAREEQQRMRESIRGLGDDFSRFFDDAIFGAGKLTDAFASMAKGMASGGLQALLTGSGPMAGLLGTANPIKGEQGGLLGGILPTGLKDLISEGAEKGTKAGASAGTIGGLDKIFGDVSGRQLLQGAAGLSMMLGSYSIGQQAQTRTQAVAGGALSGAVGGAMLGGQLGPAGAVAGGIFGAVMSWMGFDDAASQRRKQELQQAQEQYRQSQSQIDAMRAGFRGEATTGVEATLKAAYAQAADAATLAQKAGDAAGAAAIMADQTAFSARLRAQFAATYAGILTDLEAGRGTGGPFGAAAAAAAQLGESLKGFVKDAEGAGLGIDRARSVAIKGALASIEGPKQLSATAAELERIRGTAAGLSQVLVDLGMSATDAAEAIRSRTSAALKGLRSTFRADLDAQINDASGRGYRNDIADAVAARTTGLADARALGTGRDRVEKLFALSIQKIVTESQLAGPAFDGLLKRFPQLRGKVEEFSEALAKTETAADRAAKAAEIASRKQGYDDRAFAARVDTDTKAGALAAFDRRAAQDRAEEARAGGQAMKALEKALAAERLGIIKDYARQETEAKRQAAEQQKQAAIEARDFLTGTFKSYRSFIDDLNAGSGSTLSPGDRYAAAKGQFSQQLAIAKGSDLTAAREALSSLTQYASNLLDASKAMYASGEAYQNDRLSVIDALSGLPKQVDATDLIVSAITTASKDQLSKQELIREAAALTAINVANTKTAIEANSPGAIASALQNGFDQIDTNKNGRLSLAEFTKALGPLSTKEEQTTARAIFDKIDASGNDALEKAELIRAQAEATATGTAAAAANALATKAAVDAAANSNLTGLSGIIATTGLNSPTAINNALRGNFSGLATDSNLQNTVPDKINTSIKGNFNGLASDTGIGNVRSSVDGTKGSIDSGNKTASDSQVALQYIRGYTNTTQRYINTGNRTLAEIRKLNTTQKSTLSTLNSQFTDRASLSLGGDTISNNMLTALNKIVFNTANTVVAVKNNSKGAWTYASGGYTGPGGKYDVAGTVHRGEIVWSQENIARAGGVAAVEAMRLGLPGYAAGGLVRPLNDNVAPRIMPMPVAGGVDVSALVAELRALRAENRAQAEMIGRLVKQAGEQGAEASEGTTRAVLAGGGGSQRDGKAPVGKGRSALNRSAA